MVYESRLVDETPVDRAASLVLGRRARHLVVKAGAEILRFEAREAPIADEALALLVHRDGFLNVPVLILGDLVVRGYTDDLYREALEGR